MAEVDVESVFDGYEEVANDGAISIGYYLGQPYKCHIFREDFTLIPCSEKWFYCGLLLDQGRWVEKTRSYKQ